MIGKTRRRERAPRPPPAPPRASFARGCGVLRHPQAPGAYRHLRYAPPPQLGDWIEYFWLESWSFPVTQIREVLPHPNVHLVFAPGRSRVYGVQLGRFTRELQGTGRILGVKFRYGAFYPFLGQPVGTLTGRSVAAELVLPGAGEAERDVLAGGDEPRMVERAARFLTARLPGSDPAAAAARRAVETAVRDPGVTRVRALAARVGLTERALQRLFWRYIGASPRWVIKRYRLYEALEQLTADGAVPLADLAQTLGYFDQAHFANDFRRSVGRAPARYARVRGGPGAAGD